MNYEKCLEINSGVIKALEKGKGVVTPESNIISQGMPYPENVKIAQKCNSKSL